METKQPKSNIVSLDWKRREVREKVNKEVYYRNVPLEQRVVELENEMDRIIGILLETTDLAEKNRDHLLTLLKRLKEHKYL